SWVEKARRLAAPVSPCSPVPVSVPAGKADPTPGPGRTPESEPTRAKHDGATWFTFLGETWKFFPHDRLYRNYFPPIFSGGSGSGRRNKKARRSACPHSAQQPSGETARLMIPSRPSQL